VEVALDWCDSTHTLNGRVRFGEESTMVDGLGTLTQQQERQQSTFSRLSFFWPRIESRWGVGGDWAGGAGAAERFCEL
jgi:hypothetical protein